MKIKVKQTEGAESIVGSRGTGVDAVRNQRGPTGAVADLVALRNRARNLTATNPYASRALVQLVGHLVGSGISAKINATGEPVPEDPLQRMWNDWAGDPMQCDSGGQLNFAGLQRQVVRTLIESGECLVLRQDADQQEDDFDFYLQVLEPDYLDTNRRESFHGDGGLTVDRDGIRYVNGRPQGYWIFPEHPDDQRMANVQSVFYPAELVIHLYRPDRPGQRRGRTWLEPVLDGIQQLDDSLSSEQERFRFASMWVGFMTDLQAASTGEKPQFEEIEPGTIELLPPGRDIKLSTPPTAPNLEQTVVVMLRRIAAGLGLPYETFTGDYTRTNFSSAKMSGNQLDMALEEFRSTVLYPMFLDRVFTWWKQAAGAEDAMVQWTPPRARLVDPQKEVEALVAQVRAGLISWPDAVRRMGGDPDQLLEEVANVNARFDELGIVFDSDGRYSVGGAGKMDADKEQEQEDGVSRPDQSRN